MKANELKDYLKNLKSYDDKLIALKMIMILANNFSHDLKTNSIVYIFDEFKVRFDDNAETFEITSF
jgi:hypothetical protein